MHGALGFFLFAALAVAFTLPASVAAQIGVEGERPVHVQGYWDHKSSDPGIIGTITFAAPGKKPRSFGAIAVQAYMALEQGTQVFTDATMQPVINVQGRKDMVERFMGAPSDQLVRVFGVFEPHPSADFILMAVNVVPPPSKVAPAPSGK